MAYFVCRRSVEARNAYLFVTETEFTYWASPNADRVVASSSSTMRSDLNTVGRSPGGSK